MRRKKRPKKKLITNILWAGILWAELSSFGTGPNRTSFFFLKVKKRTSFLKERWTNYGCLLAHWLRIKSEASPLWDNVFPSLRTFKKNGGRYFFSCSLWTRCRVQSSEFKSVSSACEKISTVLSKLVLQGSRQRKKVTFKKGRLGALSDSAASGWARDRVGHWQWMTQYRTVNLVMYDNHLITHCDPHFAKKKTNNLQFAVH